MFTEESIQGIQDGGHLESQISHSNWAPFRLYSVYILNNTQYIHAYCTVRRRPSRRPPYATLKRGVADYELAQASPPVPTCHSNRQYAALALGNSSYGSP